MTGVSRNFAVQKNRSEVGRGEKKKKMCSSLTYAGNVGNCPPGKEEAVVAGPERELQFYTGC